MDWSKAKNIILIMLVVTNLFILAMYGAKYMRTERVKNDDSVYQYTVNVLEENNIYLDCEIPERINKMAPLTVTYGKYDENIVNNNMSRINVIAEEDRNDESYSEAADKFIQKCGYMGDMTRRVSVKSEDGLVKVQYKNYYRDIPLEECYMTVSFEDGKITDFERKWMEVVDTGDTRIEIMSPLSALLNFMSSQDAAQKTVINDMYITYWIDSYDVNANVLYDTAFPAWCIRYNDNQIKYISAIMQ